MENSRLPILLAVLPSLVVYLASFKWFSAVSSVIREPDHDEIYHVPQAWEYCTGNFHVWDQRITTPPGVYLLSYLFYRLTGDCSIDALRLLNTLILALVIPFSAYEILLRKRTTHLEPMRSSVDRLSAYISTAHTAINIGLFPPLFFFSALYYTDVSSTASVLLFHLYFNSLERPQQYTLFQGVVLFLLGLLTLCFRQTNIFWVSVFPAGISIVRALEHEIGDHEHVDKDKAGPTAALHNPSVEDAAFQDYLWNLTSIASLVIRNPTRTIQAVIPYLAMIGVFGAFVVWNGGVVLGDRSNHIPAIHLPQMLYIWAYIIFFSWPIAAPYIMAALLPKPLVPFALQPYRSPILPKSSTAVVLAIATSVISVFAVHYFTIVHPFTLADNRHYVFYVFRLLQRHPAIKYLCVPVYLVCAWATIKTLGNPKVAAAESATAVANGYVPETSEHTNGYATEIDGRVNHRVKPQRKARADGVDEHVKEVGPFTTTGAKVSFVNIWLVTAALSVITAPLVEPRYFIVHWIMWRMNVPILSPPSPFTINQEQHQRQRKHQRLRTEDGNGFLGVSWQILDTYDHRLWFETAWYLLINIVTGYVLLHKGFAWPHEPGVVRRFLY